MIGRRGFITSLVSLVTAPAIVRAGSLMPVRVVEPQLTYGPMLDAAMLAEAERLVNPAWLPNVRFQLGDLVEYEGNMLMVVPGWVMDDLRGTR